MGEGKGGARRVQKEVSASAAAREAEVSLVAAKRWGLVVSFIAAGAGGGALMMVF